MKKLLLTSLIALSASTSHIVFAQDNDTPNSRNTIFISDGRTGIDLDKKSSNYRFSQTDIENSPAQDVAELLNTVPGVSFEHSGGRGTSTNLRIRGSESDHVLVLVDGVRTASATNGSTALQNIPLSHIERIEVIKGPKSGVYGADALGGVVQIFTKKGKDSVGGYIELGVGSHNASQVAAGFNESTGDFYYGINVNQFQTDGINRKINVATGPDLDRDGYDEKGVSLNIGRDALSGLGVDFSYSYNEGNVEFDQGNATNSTDFETQTISFAADYTINSDVTLNLQLGQFEDERETFGSPSIFKTDRDSITAFIEHQISDETSLVLGYDYYDDAVSGTTDYAQTDRDNAAFFAEYALKASSLTAQLTYRTDDNQAYGKNDSFSVYLANAISDDQSISLSYSTAFKAPTFNDLYFPLQFGFQGNPSLQPEESKTVEVAYFSKLNSLDLDVAVYQTKTTNLIQLTPTFSTVVNVSEAEFLGADISLTQRGDTLNWGASLSHVDARNAQTQERLNRRPRATFKLFADKTMNKWVVSGSWLVEDGRRQSATTTTGGYGLVDVGATYHFSNKNNVRLDIKNVFDKDYILIDGFSTFATEGTTFELSYKHLL